MQFDHFNISAPMAELQKLVAFYTELFGWKPGFRPHFSRKGFWLYQGTQPILHLTESDEHLGRKGHFLDHLAFRAEDPGQFMAKLKEMQWQYTSHKVPELSMLQLFFTDPVGIGLEVNFHWQGDEDARDTEGAIAQV